MGMSLILASGGINSTVTAARVRQTGDVHLVHFDFGQRSAGPRRAAVAAIAEALRCRSTSIELPHVAQIALLKNSRSATVQAGGARPAGTNFKSVSDVAGLMPSLLGSALQLANSIGADTVLTGASELADEIESESAPGEGTPDHRRDFYYLYGVMLEVLQKSKSPVRLDTPLIDLARDEIIKLAMRYDTPLELTYSCLEGTQPPCGNCPGCRARRKAFESANLIDPCLPSAVR